MDGKYCMYHISDIIQTCAQTSQFPDLHVMVRPVILPNEERCPHTIGVGVWKVFLVVSLHEFENVFVGYVHRI